MLNHFIALKRCVFFYSKHSGRAPKSLELDTAVLNYLLAERAHGCAVNNKQILGKAVEIAAELGGLDGFQGSEGWLRRWKKRNHVGIRRGTNESQKIPEDYAEQCKVVRNLINNKRKTLNYPLLMIGNMDQTMVNFDMAPKTTNNLVGERSVRMP